MVLNIIPLSPTAVSTILISGMKHLRKCFNVPLFCKTQDSPPLVVLIIVPSHPTAVPLFVSANETQNNDFVVPLFF